MSALAKLIKLISSYNLHEGENHTPIPWLSIYMSSKNFMLMPCNKIFYVLFIVDGAISVNNIYETNYYRKGDIYIPEITSQNIADVNNNSGKDVFIAVIIDININEVISIIIEQNNKFISEVISNSNFNNKNMFYLEDIYTSILRLLSFNDDSIRTNFISKNIKREIIFNIIYSIYGTKFLRNIVNYANADKILLINNWIKENFRSSFNIEELAYKFNMSVSLFYQKFKSIIGMPPLQCQKFLRLNEARRLMIDKNLNVTEASLEVGYGNVSQFIREYRKMFGVRPKEEILKLRCYLKK